MTSRALCYGAVGITLTVLTTPLSAKDDCGPFVAVNGQILGCVQQPKCNKQDGSCVLVVRQIRNVRYFTCRCNCPDPILSGKLQAQQTINLGSLPQIVTFVPTTDPWTVSGILGGDPSPFNVTGSVTVQFASDPLDSELVRATLVAMSLTTADLPIGANTLELLDAEHPFIAVDDSTLPNSASMVLGSSFFLVDTTMGPTNGQTEGVLAAQFAHDGLAFSYKGTATGSTLDFLTGLWDWTLEGTTCAIDEPILTEPIGACRLPGGIPGNCCTEVENSACAEVGGTYMGDGTTCGVHGECIPTVSEWGVAVMALLVVSAATIVIRRRRRAAVA